MESTFTKKSCKLLIILTLAIMLSPFPSKIVAQKVIEIKYKFFKGEPNFDSNGNIVGPLENDLYDALLFYYSEESEQNIMRVSFEKNTKIVEQKFDTGHVNTNNGWVIDCENPKFIKGKGEYFADFFSFEKKNGAKEYTPFGIIDDDSKTGKIISYRTIYPKDMTIEFLSKWNWQKKWLDQSFVSDQDPVGSRLHLFLVADKYDRRLPQHFRNNNNNIKAMFKEMADECDLEIVFHDIPSQSKAYNKSTVTNEINNASISSNDVVLLYYSGHGFRWSDTDPTEKPWPYLDLIEQDPVRGTKELLQQNSLYLANLYNSLGAKQPRLLLVVGECCNSNVGVVEPKSIPHFDLAGSEIGFADREKLKKLFAQSGRVLVATSSPGESSIYDENTGGVWGRNFLTAIREVASPINSGEVSWESIVNKATQATQQQTKMYQIFKDGQQAIMHIDVK